MLMLVLLTGLLVGCEEEAVSEESASLESPDAAVEEITAEETVIVEPDVEEVPVDEVVVSDPVVNEMPEVGDTDEPPLNADGADQLFLDFQNAIRAQDADAMVACFYFGDSMQEAAAGAAIMSSSFESAFALSKFHDAAETRFGEAGIIEIFGEDAAGQAGFEDILDLSPEEMTYNIEGDRGVVLDPDGNPMNIIRVGDRWMLDLTQNGPSPFPTDPAEVQAMVAMADNMTALFEGLTAQVGEEDATPTTLKEAMENGMFEIMMQMMAQQGMQGPPMPQ
jgi:hypothetical protein